MDEFIKALFGPQSALAQDIISNYWVIPGGLLVLYFYGRSHFNTPAYALSEDFRVTEIGLIKYMPLSRMRAMTPPKFTTSRGRYNRYMVRYILILQLAFLILTCFPEIVKYSSEIIYNSKRFSGFSLPETVQQRSIWALFALTGLLSTFPGLKDLDAWLLTNLHQNAAIPDSAENTAQMLFDVDYKSHELVLKDIFRTVKNITLTQVLENKKTGVLEQNWINLRCLSASMKRFTFIDKNTVLLRILKSDFDEIEDYIFKLRDKMIEFFDEQSKILPAEVVDIDSFYENSEKTSPIKEIYIKRETLDLETQALRYRLCRLCALATYATELRPEDMDRSLKQMGFQIGIIRVPSWHWESIVKVTGLLLMAILFPSFIYAYVSNDSSMEIPANLQNYVPNSPIKVLVWALMGVCLHVVSIIIALKVKRFYARVERNQDISNSHQEMITAISCYVVILFIQALFIYINNLPVWEASLWAILPTTTGVYVCKYVEKSRQGQLFSRKRAFRQGIFMGVTSFFITIFILTPNFHLANLPYIVWVFTAYAAITAFLIGTTIGFTFQKTYSHSKYLTDAALGIEALHESNRKIVGDILLEKVQVFSQS